MIVGTYFERKFKHRRELELEAAREKAREEGRMQGRAEIRKRNAEFNALFEDWLKRRDEAREKGEPFDEPVPPLKE